MNIDEYMPIINGKICFYINENGLLTIDENWHIPIIKLSILYYWERFSNAVGHVRLWKTLVNLKMADRLYFHVDGTPFNPPTGIKAIIDCEKEKEIIKYMRKNTVNWINIGFLCVLIFVIWHVAAQFLDFKTYLFLALTKDAIH